MKTKRAGNRIKSRYPVIQSRRLLYGEKVKFGIELMKN